MDLKKISDLLKKFNRDVTIYSAGVIIMIIMMLSSILVPNEQMKIVGVIFNISIVLNIFMLIQSIYMGGELAKLII